MKLIDNWPRLWRSYAVQSLALITVLQGTLATLPQSALETLVPGVGFTWGSLLVALTAVTALLGGIGRMIDQGGIAQ